MNYSGTLHPSSTQQRHTVQLYARPCHHPIRPSIMQHDAHFPGLDVFACGGTGCCWHAPLPQRCARQVLRTRRALFGLGTHAVSTPVREGIPARPQPPTPASQAMQWFAAPAFVYETSASWHDSYGTECLGHLYLACAPDPHQVLSLYWNLLARSAAPGRGTARLAGAPSPPSPPCLVPTAQGTARQLKAALSWPLSGLGKPYTHALSPQSLHSANCVWRVTMPPCSPTPHRAAPALRTVFALPAATHRLQPLTPPPSCHPPARATGCLPSLPSTGCSLGSVPAPATPPGALPRLGICHVDPRNSFQPCVL